MLATELTLMEKFDGNALYKLYIFCVQTLELKPLS